MLNARGRNRTRAIFEWVFGLPPTPSPAYHLEYVASPAMLEGDVLAARVQREVCGARLAHDPPARPLKLPLVLSRSP